MDSPNMVLKTKLSEILEVLNYIILVYAIFLAIIGVKFHNTELILQTSIMGITYIVFEYINFDTTTIIKKGFKSGKNGLILWDDIYRLERKNRVISVYTKLRKKPYKISVKKSEDQEEISRVYKYMLSKVKSPEKMKDLSKFEEDY